MAGAPVTPYTIAMVYALKHVLSLITFAKTGKQESGEGLRGRHMDARNYFFILNELVPDHVNHFEQYDDSDWWSDEANDLFTEATQESDEYPTIITEDPISGTVKYLDEADHDWHPISELEKRKEVNNTTLNGSLAACSGDCCCCIGSLVEIGDLRDKR
jgi:hypothetical protein